MSSVKSDNASPGPAREELLDALRVVCEALAVPHAVTIGGQKVRDVILVERAGHAGPMRGGILGGEPFLDVPWSEAYLRQARRALPGRLQDLEARVAELEAAREAGQADRAR